MKFFASCSMLVVNTVAYANCGMEHILKLCCSFLSNIITQDGKKGKEPKRVLKEMIHSGFQDEYEWVRRLNTRTEQNGNRKPRILNKGGKCSMERMKKLYVQADEICED